MAFESTTLIDSNRLRSTPVNPEQTLVAYSPLQSTRLNGTNWRAPRKSFHKRTCKGAELVVVDRAVELAGVVVFFPADLEGEVLEGLDLQAVLLSSGS